MLRALIAIPAIMLIADAGADLSAIHENLHQGHPRLLWHDADIARLRQHVAADPLARDLMRHFTARANALLETPPVERRVEGRRLLAISREARERILLLAFVYRMGEDPAHLARAEKEMLAAADFADWNPSHFLDVAEMTAALAIGYDWLHPDLSQTTRDRVREAIITKGLEPAMKPAWYFKTTNNWNQVCNGGITLGALAIAEDRPDLAEAIVRHAIEMVPIAGNQYEPDGVYPEGPGYWSYGTTYHVLLVAALQSALGSQFGLADSPGFRKTPEFMLQATGPTGRTFNFSDSGDGRGVSPAMFWFSSLLANPIFANDEDRRLERKLAGADPARKPLAPGSLDPLILLWRASALEATAGTRQPPLPALHWTGAGPNPVAFHRSAWDDPQALYVGIKAGTPAHSHGHMDSGSFVLDLDGVRWVSDPKVRNYHELESAGVDYFKSNDASDRWRVFEAGPFSHNTITLDGKLHKADSVTPILHFSASPEKPFTVLDLTDVFDGRARRAVRGFAPLPGRRLLVQDDLEGLPAGSKVCWAIFTDAKIEIEDRRARLTHDGKSLTIDFLAPEDVEIRIEELADENLPFKKALPGKRMLVAHATATEGDLTRIAALFTPGSSSTLPPPADLTSPESWSAPGGPR